MEININLIPTLVINFINPNKIEVQMRIKEEA